MNSVVRSSRQQNQWPLTTDTVAIRISPLVTSLASMASPGSVTGRIEKSPDQGCGHTARNAPAKANYPPRDALTFVSGQLSPISRQAMARSFDRFAYGLFCGFSRASAPS